VNRYISERATNARFATVFYCLIDQDGSVLWVNAGHCPALLVHADGSLESWPAVGPPVGLFPEAEFPEQSARLSPGDKVIIYSDGVSEAHNDLGEQFGEKRLATAVVENASRDAAGLSEALKQRLTAFTGDTPQKDDLTLLVLGYRGPRPDTDPS
jgi:sigma-B regulation protein RsbU (phosphoserine phosphatase)